MKFGVRVFGYSVRRDGFDILLQTSGQNLSSLMRQINGLQAIYINKKYDLDGSLFKGRYRSVLVEPGPSLLARSAMIHRLYGWDAEKSAASYNSWSLYDGRVRRSWLDRNFLPGLLGKGAGLADYRDYVSHSPDKPAGVGRRCVANAIEGSEEYLNSIMASVSDISREVPDRSAFEHRPAPGQILAAVASHYQTDSHAITQPRRGRYSQNTPRMVAMYLCQKVACSSLKQIADIFRLTHYASAANSISRLRAMISQDLNLEKCVHALEVELLAEGQ